MTPEMIVAQVAIATLGVSAVALTQLKNPRAGRWAPVLGLLGQPFWFYSTWVSEQWGMFALCWLYTASWGYGFYQKWIKKAAK